MSEAVKPLTPVAPPAATPVAPAPKVAPATDDLVTLKIVLSRTQADAQFCHLLSRMAEQAHENSKKKGFWEEINYDRKLLLIHGEVSEIMEALRMGNPMDDKCPDFTSEEIELADVFLRGMDYAAQKKLRLAEAILAKHRYNLTRPAKHGKAF